MANSSKKIDFKEEKLSVDTIANASKWWEQARDEFVQVGLSQQLSVGPSLEERVRTAQVKVDAIEGKKSKKGESRHDWIINLQARYHALVSM